MSDQASPQFVTCPCQVCNGHIEFDVTWAGQTVECPHCKMQTALFVPQQISQRNNPPLLAAQPAKEIPRKHSKSTAEIIALLAIIGLIGWTALCGLGAVGGTIEIIASERDHPTITSSNELARAGGTLGFIIGMAIWFGIWLAGAIPAFMVFIIARLSVKKTPQTGQ